jgi:hypothetical protein
MGNLFFMLYVSLRHVPAPSLEVKKKSVLLILSGLNYP